MLALVMPPDELIDVIAEVMGGLLFIRTAETNGCYRCDDRNIAYSNKGAEYDEVVGF